MSMLSYFFVAAQVNWFSRSSLPRWWGCRRILAEARLRRRLRRRLQSHSHLSTVCPTAEMANDCRSWRQLRPPTSDLDAGDELTGRHRLQLQVRLRCRLQPTVASGYRRGDGAPNPCAGRRSHSSGLRCNHCTSRLPSDRSSSTSVKMLIHTLVRISTGCKNCSYFVLFIYNIENVINKWKWKWKWKRWTYFNVQLKLNLTFISDNFFARCYFQCVTDTWQAESLDL